MGKTGQKAKNRGVTLLELMTIVAIIGILAAVAIPVYMNYLKESKCSEVPNILQGIKEKEEVLFNDDNLKRYTRPLPWCPYDVAFASTAGTCGNSFQWVGCDAAWLNLGAFPAGATHYTYQVLTGYDAAGQVVNAAYPAVPGTAAWPAQAGLPWLVIQAAGDVDCDTRVAWFTLTNYIKEPLRTSGPNLPLVAKVW